MVLSFLSLQQKSLSARTCDGYRTLGQCLRRVETLHGYMVKMLPPSPTSLRPAVAGLRRVERLRRPGNRCKGVPDHKVKTPVPALPWVPRLPYLRPIRPTDSIPSPSPGTSRRFPSSLGRA